MQYKRIILTIISLLMLNSVFVFSQKNDAEVIKYETKYNVSSNHILTESVSIIIQINKRKAENLTEISIPHSKNSPIIELSAQITDVFGKKIRKLKKKEIETKSHISSISLYEDDFIKTFTLKHNVYPYRISYNYKIEHKKFFNIAYWTPYLFYKTPTTNATLELSIPSDYKVLIDEKNIQKAIILNDDKKRVYSWKSKYLKEYKYNLFAPKEDASIPYVRIVPANFKYGIKGNQETWKNFGNWRYNLKKGLDVLPKEAKIEIDNVLKKANTDKDKIEALYKYMQNSTRYINVSIDIGGFKPYPASYVYENKYGDCKALTNYMNSILTYAGIKSYYSLIYAGDNFRKIDKEFTSSQFNHIILFIPNKKDTTWLECTNKYSPTGYLGTFTQGRNALIIKEYESEFVKTPKLNINDVEEKRTVSFQYENDGDVIANINLNLKGNEYENFKTFSKIYSETQKNKYIHEYIPFNNYDINKWETIEVKDDASIIFKAKLNLKKYIKNYDDLKFLAIYPTNIPDFEKPKKRTKNVHINYPININDSLIYQKLEGYKYQAIKDTSIISKYGSYKIKGQELDDKIVVNKQFILFSGEYKLSEYKSFYNFIKSAKNIERKSPIVFVKTK